MCGCFLMVSSIEVVMWLVVVRSQAPGGLYSITPTKICETFRGIHLSLTSSHSDSTSSHSSRDKQWYGMVLRI